METDAAQWAPQSPDFSGTHDLHDLDVPTQHLGYKGSISHITPFSPPASSPPRPDPMPPSLKTEHDDDDGEYHPDAVVKQKPSRARKPKQEGNGAGSNNLVDIEHIEVRTKFPVARIKRIMQADDDVGKVAQVTPVVVSKALELFMISLVTKAAAEAKARSSKRVTSAHLKQAVSKDEQFDFLTEIVSKVADAPAAAEKSEDTAMEIDRKKRTDGARRKRKVDDDDF